MTTKRTLNILLSLLGAMIISVGIWATFLLDQVQPQQLLVASLAAMFVIILGAGLLASSIPRIYK